MVTSEDSGRVPNRLKKRHPLDTPSTFEIYTEPSPVETMPPKPTPKPAQKSGDGGANKPATNDPPNPPPENNEQRTDTKDPPIPSGGPSTTVKRPFNEILHSTCKAYFATLKEPQKTKDLFTSIHIMINAYVSTETGLKKFKWGELDSILEHIVETKRRDIRVDESFGALLAATPRQKTRFLGQDEMQYTPTGLKVDVEKAKEGLSSEGKGAKREFISLEKEARDIPQQTPSKKQRTDNPTSRGGAKIPTSGFRGGRGGK